MKTVEMVFTKITSRKFLLAVAAFLMAIANDEPMLAAISAGIYIIAEGAGDAVRAHNGGAK